MQKLVSVWNKLLLCKILRSFDKGSSINDVTQFWRFFYPTPPIVTRFITEALVLLSQNPWPFPPKTVTSFMDVPLD